MMTLRGLVIAGTGTDVGKTVVAGALLRWLRGEGIDVAPMKPIQTGATRGPAGDWRIPDLDAVLAGTDFEPDASLRALMAPCIYEPACSPHLAARLAGAEIRVPAIVAAARQLASRHPFLLVELAGGVMVPVNDTETNLDLVRALGLPVLVVGLAGLGTINHTLLTLGALRSAGASVIGFVLNEAAPVDDADAYIREDNARTIAHFGGAPFLGTFPHGSTNVVGALPLAESLRGVFAP